MGPSPIKYHSMQPRSKVAIIFFSLLRLFRIAFVCTFMVLFVMVILIYSFNHALLPKSTRAPTFNFTSHSPLQNLLIKELSVHQGLRKGDCETLKKIDSRSTLEVKMLVIAETVVPYKDREKLGNFVWEQLESSDVLTPSQASALASMVKLAPVESSVSEEETGKKGTLRNFAVLALIKRNLITNNIHFMAVGARAEPRLGWRWISWAERNAWNEVLSRALSSKVREEARGYLWQQPLSKGSVMIEKKVQSKLASELFLPEACGFHGS